ncbi:MAG: MBL fold metallo-hydrolase [Desulfuromonadales bacterium]|nr:MBL fold metallo-hydrolase [Desulfuromonadales bacterium]
MTAPRGKRRLPFRYCEPAFFGGLLDDPVLFLRIRPLRRALLFDCGQIAHLAKRVIKPIQAVFITHAHMDHVMGIPTLVRHHHASPRPLDVFGPAGITERTEHLLMGFDWNLAEPTWFTLRVHEVLPDRILHSSFPGPQGFVRRDDGESPCLDRKIWACPFLTVEAEILDHKLPVLAFRVNERSYFSVEGKRLDEQGLVAGEWIRDLKSRVWKKQAEHRVTATWRRGELLLEEPVDDPEALYESIRGNSETASLGYMTDMGWTADNVETIRNFMGGLTLLCSECTFLAADREKARASHHLTSTDLNTLLESLRPRYLLAMHLSKGYLRRTFDLYAELKPPSGTRILRLPNHIVPAPLGAREVDRWLRPA